MNSKQKSRSDGNVLFILLGLVVFMVCVPMAFWWGVLTLWNWFVLSAGWHATIAVNWITVTGAWMLRWLIKLILT